MSAESRITLMRSRAKAALMLAASVRQAKSGAGALAVDVSHSSRLVGGDDKTRGNAGGRKDAGMRLQRTQSETGEAG